MLYTAALDMDRQLDAKLMQHRTHVAVMAGTAKKTQKTLRVFLQSRHHNTAPGPPGHASGESAMQNSALPLYMSLINVCPISAASEPTASRHIV